MTGEPTAMQFAAAVPETARSEPWRGASGDRLDLPGRARPHLDVGDPIAVEHCTAIQQLGEGGVQAVCSCGWRSAVFGSDKATGTMDPLQPKLPICTGGRCPCGERYRSRDRTSLPRPAT